MGKKNSVHKKTSWYCGEEVSKFADTCLQGESGTCIVVDNFFLFQIKSGFYFMVICSVPARGVRSKSNIVNVS